MRDELDVRVGGQSLVRGAGAAAAAADQADPQHVAAGGMGAAGDREFSRDGPRRGGGRSLQKVATRRIQLAHARILTAKMATGYAFPIFPLM